MKLSDRLRSCADLVRRGNVAADVGTDHGYLAITLLQEGICPKVYASDLREGPLSAARRSAIREGVTEDLELRLSDGLHNLNMTEIRTVICAGMGGDTIQHILEEAPAVRDPEVQLVLQPQSKTADLRIWLGEHGFEIREERLSRDGNFLYTAMDAGYTGQVRRLSPGQAYFPQYLFGGDQLAAEYCDRVVKRLRKTVDGLHKSKKQEPELLSWYETALRDVEERRSYL